MDIASRRPTLVATAVATPAVESSGAGCWTPDEAQIQPLDLVEDKTERVSVGGSQQRPGGPRGSSSSTTRRTVAASMPATSSATGVAIGWPMLREPPRDLPQGRERAGVPAHCRRKVFDLHAGGGHPVAEEAPRRQASCTPSRRRGVSAKPRRGGSLGPAKATPLLISAPCWPIVRIDREADHARRSTGTSFSPTRPGRSVRARPPDQSSRAASGENASACSLSAAVRNPAGPQHSPTCECNMGSVVRTRTMARVRSATLGAPKSDHAFQTSLVPGRTAVSDRSCVAGYFAR